jgi:spectinomycin phosphotransferase
MLSPPADLSTDDIRVALRAGWGTEAVTIAYRAVGFGSHHWAVTDAGGTRWFVTADRATAHLEPALRTAIALRDAGLEFVVAPERTGGGNATQPAGQGYLLSVYPHVDAEAGHFGRHRTADKPDVYAMLARLHATPAPTAEPLDLGLPGRDGLQKARREVGDGPYGRSSNALLHDRGELIDELLEQYDRLRETLPSRDQWVVTHGEPHPGNVMRAADGLRLVDWDTVRLAPKARDLWHVDDRPAYAFFRLRWRLSDIAGYAHDLSVPHPDTADTSAMFGYLRECLAHEDA